MNRCYIIVVASLFAMYLNAQSTDKTYEKFDFVQGNKILFEDDFIQESLNEIPAYWELGHGRVEVAEIGGEKCMGLLSESHVSPRKKGVYSIEDKLTFEFDYLIRSNIGTFKQAYIDGSGYFDLAIQFISDKENEEISSPSQILGDFYQNLNIRSDGLVTFNDYTGKYSNGQVDAETDLPADLLDKWVHVSIAVNKNTLKVYLNAQRVLNAQINHGDLKTFQLNADYSSAEEDGQQVFIKNVRIAEGGADPYKVLATNGKYIARGITFESGKSVIRPASLGEINALVKLMNTDATLKFEIGGHTDSDGDDQSNLKLSQARADAVRSKLIELGIDGSRLIAKGYGESKPLVDNASPENKATNRRVEFVKIN
jgi:OmpA-OmpF porin, OOP family